MLITHVILNLNETMDTTFQNYHPYLEEVKQKKNDRRCDKTNDKKLLNSQLSHMIDEFTERYNQIYRQIKTQHVFSENKLQRQH